MRVYFQVKQLVKRKCCIEKLPVDFSVPPTNVQELIASIVSWQVSKYNDRLQQSEVLQYLTREEVEDKAASGKVGFEVNYNGSRRAFCSYFTKIRHGTHLYPTDYAIGKIMVSIYNNPQKTDNHENHLQ